MPKKAQKMSSSPARQQAIDELENEVGLFQRKIADLQRRVSAFLLEQHTAHEADSLKKARKKLTSK